MRPPILRRTLGSVLMICALPSVASAQADPRIEALKAEALEMVQARAETVQEMVDPTVRRTPISQDQD